MHFLTLALGLVFALVAAMPAEAQRGNWELLGEQRVGLGVDRDIIDIGRDEAFFRNRAYRTLRFVAEGGDVRMRSVRLHYLNGYAEDFKFEQTLRPGREIDIDLRGERSFLRRIEMVYQAKLGVSIGPGGVRIAQPTVRVFGENVRSGPPIPPPPPPPPPPRAGGFDEITRERFDRRDSEVSIRVGRREGQFGQIRLRNTSDSRIDVVEAIAVFGDGSRQRIRVGETLEAGDQTRPMSLEGGQRTLRSVTVVLDPRRRPGPAEIALLGTPRPGRDAGPPPPSDPGFRPPRASWQLLGQKEVGFRVGRDVLRIDQSLDWRDRGFDQLHFVAERNEIHLMSLRIVYINGFAEEFRVDRLIGRNNSFSLDLPGRRSFLREVEMVYRARPGFRGEAVISIFGETAPRRR